MKLQVKDLDLKINDKNILKGISMDIFEQNSIGIIGPNGSGKSTLLKCIYRVLKPTKGSIFIDDMSLKDISYSNSSKKMAVVAQHNEQSFDFSVLEMVLMGRSPHKKFFERDNEEDLKIAKDCLDKVGMSGFENRLYSSLSGGERQRVILARALAQKTSCLILDEPTNHLDIRYQIQFMDIANSLGITVISAIHDLNLALTYCNYLFALKDGKIYAKGRPEDVISEDLIENLYQVKSTIRKIDDKILIMYDGLK